MDKTTLCYCTPNLHKLVCQAPLSGGVLASIEFFFLKVAILKKNPSLPLQILDPSLGNLPSVRRT